MGKSDYFFHVFLFHLQKELDGFLDYTRMKFVGFKLQDDRTTLAGMPKPIHEGVRILNNYIYKSLGEVSLIGTLSVNKLGQA